MPAIDNAAFEACYRRVFPLVMAKCQRMLRNRADAAEVAQEVFVRLWKNRALIDDPEALTAWLYRASTRLVIDRVRQRRVSDESLAHLQSLTVDDRDDSEARLASRRQLRVVIAELPPAELEVAILSRIDRMTHAEIARVMGLGERTVRRLLHRFDERAITIQEIAK